MAQYVDGFVVPVPENRLDEYKELADLAGKVWKEHGALSYQEFTADDVKPGKVTSFPQSVDLKEGEIVVFSFITYESREHRDQVNKKAMEDPRMSDLDMSKVPFDGKRLIWGGFKNLISL